jgi:hypothetical protein
VDSHGKICVGNLDVVTGGRDCPINTNKHTLQLTARVEIISRKLDANKNYT